MHVQICNVPPFSMRYPRPVKIRCAEELQTEETQKFTKGNLREMQVSLTGWHFPKCQHAHDVPQFLPLHRCAISRWWPMAQRRCKHANHTNSKKNHLPRTATLTRWYFLKKYLLVWVAVLRRRFFSNCLVCVFTSPLSRDPAHFHRPTKA